MFNWAEKTRRIKILLFKNQKKMTHTSFKSWSYGLKLGKLRFNVRKSVLTLRMVDKTTQNSDGFPFIQFLQVVAEQPSV